MKQRPRSLVLDDTRPIWKSMGIFLIPLMLSNILQSASSTFSSIFLGRLIGVEALAAVSAFFPVFFFLVSFVIGIASGSTILIGQAFGAQNIPRVKQIAGTALGLSLLLGLIVALVGNVFVHQLLLLVGTPANIEPASEQYSRILFYALPILFAYIMYTTFLRGTGDSTTPFYFLILTTALSVVATPALILGWIGLPQLGVNGAAVATVFANGVSVVALLVWLGVKKQVLALDRELLIDVFRINWPTALLIVKIGIPAGLQLVMVSLSEIAVITFVNRFGSDATAAYGAVNQVVSYVQFPAISIGITAAIFGAQSIGAGRQDRLGQIVRSAVGLNYAIGGVFILICYIFSWMILGMFLTTQHTLDIAHTLLDITLWSYVIFGNAAVLSGVMRSSGTVFWPTTLAIATVWLVEVPVAYILSQRIGIDGVWIAYPVAFLTNLCAQTIYYRMFWKKHTIVALV